MLLAETGLDSHAMELLGGGLIAVALLKIVLDFLAKRKEAGERVDCSFDCKKQIEDLHRWHSPDGQGEQTWKNTQMLRIVEGMNGVIEDNTVAIRELTDLVKDMRREKNGKVP